MDCLESMNRALNLRCTMKLQMKNATKKLGLELHQKIIYRGYSS
ncbi:hypothetical protein ACF3M2_03935 [Tissierella carlieri]|jgi:hypothetical protein|nr:hypothetical protein [Tissierella sp. P1]MDU5080447.1 hypothetical protein [Bacillota bacterium]